MIAWPDVEAALQGRPGWRRVGREYHGPCPVSGAGRDCCFASEGQAGGVKLGCRRCGVRLESEAFRAHLDALVGEPARHVAPHATNARAGTPTLTPTPTPSPLPARLWRASAAPEQTPGARYLEQRGVWPAGERLPASVRWLPTEAARRGDCRPSLPSGAAGCVVYRFAGPHEVETNAAELEAVDAHAAAVRFYEWKPQADRVKRPAVNGCTFDGGRRVFSAGGDPDRGVHLCEGPLDALALIHLARLGSVELDGAAVYGAQSTSGFTARACTGRGPVTVWRDRDTNGQGQRAAAQLAGELRRTGRRVTIHGAPWDGADLTDWARAVVEEREAIQHES